MGKLRRDVEMAVHGGRMADQQAGRLLKFYEEALQGYTYLEDPNADRSTFGLVGGASALVGWPLRGLAGFRLRCRYQFHEP